MNYVNSLLCMAGLLLALVVPVSAQSDVLVATDATGLVGINSQAVDTGTGNRFLVCTLTGPSGTGVQPIQWTNPDGTQTLESDFEYIRGGARDALLIHLLADGTVDWAVGFGGTGNEELLDVAVHPSGGVVVTGFIQSDFVLTDALGGETDIALLSIDGNTQDAFTAVFSDEGALKWHRVDGGAGKDLGRRVASNASSTAVLGVFDPESAAFETDVNADLAAGQTDYFLLNLDGDGQPHWQATFGSELSDYTGTRYQWMNLGLAPTASGWTVAFPWAGYNCSFEDASQNPVDAVGLTSLDAESDYCVLSINESGFYNWTKPLYCTGDMEPCVDVIADSEHVYFCATAEQLLDGDFVFGYTYTAPSFDDPFLTQLRLSDGEMQWISWMISGYGSSAHEGLATSLEFTPDGLPLVAGYYRGTLETAGGWTLMSPDDFNAFGMVYGTDGYAVQGWDSGLSGNDGALSGIYVDDRLVFNGVAANVLDADDGTQGWITLPLEPCAESPDAGVVTGSATEVCAGDPVDLETTAAFGQLQWQYREGTGPWTDYIGGIYPSGTDYPFVDPTEFRVIASSDGCESDTSNVWTVEVGDLFPVTVACPIGDLNRTTDVCTGTYALEDFTSWVTADACDGGSVYQLPAPGTAMAPGTHSVEIGHTDVLGFETSCVFDVVVAGTNATLSLPTQVLPIAANCAATLPDLSDLVTVLATCDAVTWDVYHSFGGDAMPGDDLGVGTYTVQFEALSSAGAFAFGSATVIVEDQTPPSFNTLPGDALVLNTLENCKALKPDPDALFAPLDCSGAVVTVNYVSVATGETEPTTEATLYAGSYYGEASFTDGEGNTVGYAFDVEVVDVQAPTITCPGPYAFDLPADGNSIVMPDLTGDVVVEDCSTPITLTQSPAPGSIQLSAQGATLTFEATDAAGNTSSCEVTYAVEDVTAPTVDGPASINLSAESNCLVQVPDVMPLLTVSDAASGIDTAVQTPIAGTFVDGNAPIVVTVTDNVGNSTQIAIDIVAYDAYDPVVTCPPLVNESLTTTCSYILPDFTAVATAVDNCSDAFTWSQVPAAGEAMGPSTGLQTVLVSATDVAGNTGQCTVNLLIQDAMAPEVTCPEDQTVLLSTVGSAPWDVWTSDEIVAMTTIEDPCFGTPIASAIVFDSSLDVGESTTVLVNATDGPGNTANCTFSITLVDDVDPVLDPIADQYVDLNPDQCETFELQDYTGLVSASDNGSLLISQTPAPGTVTVDPAGVQVTITANDPSGNSASVSFLVFAEDVQAPVWDCPAAPVVLVGTGEDCSIASMPALPDVSDHCGVTSINIISAVPVFPWGPGTYPVTVEALDAAGNSATCVVTYVVQDDQAPLVSGPEAMSFQLPADGNPFVLGNLSSYLTITDCQATTVSQSIAPGTTFMAPVSDEPCTLTVTDAAGLSSDHLMLISVVDMTAPDLATMDDQELLAGDACAALLPDYTTQVDVDGPADEALEWSQTPAAGTVVSGAVEVTVSATDPSSNTTEISFTVTVLDQTDPVLDCGAQVHIILENACDYALEDLTDQVMVTDNCDAALEPLQITTGETLSPSDTPYEVLFSATDAAGNSGTCALEVLVEDSWAPSLTCPEDVVYEIAASDPYPLPVPAAFPAGVNDPCGALAGLPAVSTDLEWLEIGDVVTYTYEVEDLAGNTGQCAYTLTLADSLSPVVGALPDTTISTFFDDCNQWELPNFEGLVEVWDHSEIVEISQWPPAGIQDAALVPLTVLMQVIDIHGNVSYESFDVNVIPGPPADFTVEDQTLVLEDTCEGPLPDYRPAAGLPDQCGFMWTLTQIPAPGSIVNAGTTVEVAFHLAGNDSPVETMEVTVVDGTAPAWTCPTEPQLFYVDSESCMGMVNVQTPEVYDACGVVSIEVAGNPMSAEYPAGSYTTTLTAFDAAGNSTWCEVPFQVLDITPPQITCPDPVETCNPVVSWDLPEVADNCAIADGSLTLLSDPDFGPGATFPEGLTEVSYGVEDVAGNAATCTTWITYTPMELDYALPFDALCESQDPVTLTWDAPGTVIWGGAASDAGTVVPTDLGAGTHAVSVSLELEGCEASAEYTFEVDPTPEATLIDAPDQWCMAGGDLQLNFASSMADAQWTWMPPVQTGGIIAGADLSPGSNTLELQGELGACTVVQGFNLEAVENVSFTWATLPATVCEDHTPLALNVDAPAGSTVNYGNGIQPGGTVVASDLNAGTHEIAVTVSMPGCSATETQQMMVVAMPHLDAGPDSEVCGPIMTLAGMCSDADALLQWTATETVGMTDAHNAQNTVTNNNMNTVIFTLTAESQGVCTATDQVTVEFTAPPSQPDAGPDQELDMVTTTYLDGMYAGPGSTVWKPIQTPAMVDDPTDLSSFVDHLQHGKNTFQLVATNGVCPPSVDSVDVWVNLLWSIPSGFSPNGDNVNDYFVVDGLDDPASLTVFNRWGEQVFENHQFHNNWDGRSTAGRPLPDDTYFYLLDVAGEVYNGYLIIKR